MARQKLVGILGISVSAVALAQIVVGPVTVFDGPVGGIAVGPERRLVEGTVQRVWATTSGQYAVAKVDTMHRRRPGELLPLPARTPSSSRYALLDIAGESSWTIPFLGALDGVEVSWEENGKFALIEADEPNTLVGENQVTSVYRFDAARRSVVTLARFESDRHEVGGLVTVSKLPLLYTYRYGKQPGSSQYTDARIGKVVDSGTLVWLPFEGKAPWMFEFQILSGGQVWARSPEATQSYVLDFAKQTVKSTEERFADSAETTSETGFSLGLGTHTITRGDAKESVSALWLESVSGEKPSRTPIALGVREFFVANDWTWVLYTTSEGVSYRSLQRLDADAMLALHAETARQKALRRAKQVATGLLIYSSDCDDLLPLAGNWEVAIQPYLKDVDLTKGFVYLRNGQKIGDFFDPAKDELGYISFPGGRAVAYVDGHAAIIRDKP